MKVFEIFCGQISSFEVLGIFNVPFIDFVHNVFHILPNPEIRSMLGQKVDFLEITTRIKNKNQPEQIRFGK